jgi:hypothetical protein
MIPHCHQLTHMLPCVGATTEDTAILDLMKLGTDTRMH